MTSWCRRIVQAPAFQRVVLSVILFSGLLVGLETNPNLVSRFGGLFWLLDRIILTIFVAELAVRIGSFGRQPWRFFTDPWNVFDFLIVAVCLLPASTGYAAVLRLARVLRVLRLVSVLPRLQILVGALLKSLPSMSYVALLLSLLFYVYGVIGVKFFGATDPAHFGSLLRASMTLFQIVTLEGWIELLDSQIALTGNHTLPILYFVSFILIGTMVMLNLLIGVIVNGMEEARREMEQEDRARHEARLGRVTVGDDLVDLERQVQQLQESLRSLQHRLKR